MLKTSRNCTLSSSSSLLKSIYLSLAINQFTWRTCTCTQVYTVDVFQIVWHFKFFTFFSVEAPLLSLNSHRKVMDPPQSVKLRQQTEVLRPRTLHSRPPLVLNRAGRHHPIQHQGAQQQPHKMKNRQRRARRAKLAVRTCKARY